MKTDISLSAFWLTEHFRSIVNFSYVIIRNNLLALGTWKSIKPREIVRYCVLSLSGSAPLDPEGKPPGFELVFMAPVGTR